MKGESMSFLGVVLGVIILATIWESPWWYERFFMALLKIVEGIAKGTP